MGSIAIAAKSIIQVDARTELTTGERVYIVEISNDLRVALKNTDVHSITAGGTSFLRQPLRGVLQNPLKLGILNHKP